MNLSKSTVKLFVAKVLNAVVLFLGLAYFAKVLGPSQIGVFFLFEMLVGLLSIFTDFGLRGATEKRLSEQKHPGKVLASALLLKALLFLTIAGGIFIASPYVNAYVGEQVAGLLIVALFFRETALLSVRVISGEMRVGETAILRIIQRTVWVILGVVLVSRGFGTYGLITAYIIGFVAMTGLGLCKCQTELDIPTKETSQSLVDYSKYYFVSQAGGYAYSWMDIALIGLFLTSAAVGAYEIAWRVTLLVTLLASSIGLTIFPQVSEWETENAVDRIEALLPKALTPALILVIPAFFGTVLLADEILTIIFGEGFGGAAVALMILMFQRIFQSVHVVVGRALEGIDKPNLVARATVTTIVLNIVLNVVLIPQYGIVGAAIATASSYTINTALHFYYLSQFLSIRIDYIEISWCTIASVAMFGMILVTMRVVAIGSPAELIGLIFVGAVVYFAVLVMYRPLRSKIWGQIDVVFGGIDYDA